MTEKKRKMIVYAICCIAMIWAAFNYPVKKRQVVNDTVPANQEPAQAAAALSVSSFATVDSSEEAEWGRDPFARGGYSQAAVVEGAPGFHISAVSEAGGSLMAIINGNLVSKGEEADGWKIVDITKTEVVLEHNGKNIRVKVGN